MNSSIISTWLDMMQQLIDEIYELLSELHDAPITRLLQQQIGSPV
jgi:hypothetical protein